MHHHTPTQYLIFITITVAILSTTNARELRPSDHGLTYQQNPFLPAETNEARDFFDNSASTATSTPATTTMTPPISLPLAQNISEGTWMDAPNNDGAKSRDGRVDHVKMALIVASGVCGLTGVVLLLVSGIVFLLRLQKRRNGGVGGGGGLKEEEMRMSASDNSGSTAAHANGGEKKLVV